MRQTETGPPARPHSGLYHLDGETGCALRVKRKGDIPNSRVNALKPV